MENFEIDKIMEYIKPKSGLSIPIEIIRKLQALEQYQPKIERYFYEIISNRVKEYAKSHRNYNENELEVVFYHGIDELAENTAKEINAKFNYEYQVILIFVLWAIYREMTSVMIDNRFFYRAIDFFKLQNQLEMYVITTGGYTFEQIKDMGKNMHIKTKTLIANDARWQGHVEQLRRKYLELDKSRQGSAGKKLTIKAVATWIYEHHNEHDLVYETVRDHLSKALKGEFTND